MSCGNDVREDENIGLFRELGHIPRLDIIQQIDFAPEESLDREVATRIPRLGDSRDMTYPGVERFGSDPFVDLLIFFLMNQGKTAAILGQRRVGRMPSIGGKGIERQKGQSIEGNFCEANLEFQGGPEVHFLDQVVEAFVVESRGGIDANENLFDQTRRTEIGEAFPGEPTESGAKNNTSSEFSRFPFVDDSRTIAESDAIHSLDIEEGDLRELSDATVVG